MKSPIRPPRPGKPPRLATIYLPSPIFYVTFVARGRAPILANHPIHNAFLAYAERGLDLGFTVGRYVIMPDHVHLFVALGAELTLGRSIGGLKRILGGALPEQSRRASASTSPWQPGFFDHVLRSAESYAAKWKYVRHNPVRAGLVERPADWPFAGEVAVLEPDDTMRRS